MRQGDQAMATISGAASSPAAPTRASSAGRTGSRRAAFAILLGACALSLLFAFSSQPAFELVNRAFPSRDPVTRQVQFLLYPLALAALTTLWRPRRFGWQIGDTLKRWRVVFLTSVAVTGGTALALLVVGGTPYSGFPWPEWTLVPLAEEAVFRALFFTVTLSLLRRAGFGERSSLLAIGINALSFGLAHSSNFLYNPPLFTALQVVYATALGAALAYTRATTGSMAAPILQHALVNLVAVLI
jgi:membrane protease YdiL (CAAX protease family)